MQKSKAQQRETRYRPLKNTYCAIPVRLRWRENERRRESLSDDQDGAREQVHGSYEVPEWEEGEAVEK